MTVTLGGTPDRGRPTPLQPGSLSSSRAASETELSVGELAGRAAHKELRDNARAKRKKGSVCGSTRSEQVLPQVSGAR
eukprot:8182763-Pyramimonas_sp.AAC.1